MQVSSCGSIINSKVKISDQSGSITFKKGRGKPYEYISNSYVVLKGETGQRFFDILKRDLFVSVCSVMRTPYSEQSNWSYFNRPNSTEVAVLNQHTLEQIGKIMVGTLDLSADQVDLLNDCLTRLSRSNIERRLDERAMLEFYANMLPASIERDRQEEHVRLLQEEAARPTISISRAVNRMIDPFRRSFWRDSRLGLEKVVKNF